MGGEGDAANLGETKSSSGAEATATVAAKESQRRSSVRSTRKVQASVTIVLERDTERQRERERDIYIYIHILMCMLYIYTYISP